MASITDLWPEELAAEPAQKAPGGILREPAALLGPRTNNLLEGRVETRPDPRMARLHHSFKIDCASALDFYQFDLFSLSHGVNEFYPLEALAHGKQVQLNSEADLIAWLRTVFASPETKRIIGTLLAMIEQLAGVAGR